MRGRAAHPTPCRLRLLGILNQYKGQADKIKLQLERMKIGQADTEAARRVLDAID